MATLFILTNDWKQPYSSSIEDQLKIVYCVYTVKYSLLVSNEERKAEEREGGRERVKRGIRTPLCTRGERAPCCVARCKT